MSKKAVLKGFLTLLLLSGGFFLEGGCSRPQNPPVSTPSAGLPARKTKLLKVALLSPGPISDAGWNAAAYEGLLLIKKELGAEISQQQTKTPAEFEEAFRDYASRGYDIIFAHGHEYGDPAMRIAPEFPKTRFIITGGDVTNNKNVASLLFDLEQVTYLLGIIAGSLSRTGKVGAVGGMQIPPVERTFAGYRAGVKAVRPEGQVIIAWVGNWEDQGAAKEQTLALIHQGCDFIFHNADAAGLGVFKAVQEQKAKGVYAFGSNKDQTSVAPDVILANAVIDIPRAFLLVARSVKEGTFQAQTKHLGIKEGVCYLTYNPRMKSRIPPEVLAKIEKAQKEIVEGRLKVPDKL